MFDKKNTQFVWQQIVKSKQRHAFETSNDENELFPIVTCDCNFGFKNTLGKKKIVFFATFFFLLAMNLMFLFCFDRDTRG